MDAMTLASTAVALLAGDPATDATDHPVAREDKTRTNQPRRRCSIRDAVRRALANDDGGDVLIDLTDAPTDVSRLLTLAQALRVRVEDDTALREELDRLVAAVLQAPASSLSGSWHFAYLLQDYAESSRLAGRWSDALPAYEQSRAIMIELGDLAGAARGLNNLGAAHEDRGDLAQAAQCFASCTTAFTELDDARAAALTLINLGNIRHRQDGWDEAVHCFERAAGQLVALGDIPGAAHARTNLALVLHDQGRSEEALAVLEDCHRELIGLGDQHGAALVLVDLAAVHEDLGDWDAALQCQQRSAQMLADLGKSDDWVSVMGGLGRIHQVLGRLEEAATCYRQSADRGTNLAT
jgi:tetratricopeptide (TPR) repeat protein